MSAWIVSKRHIDALITVAQAGPTDRQPRHPGNGWSQVSFSGLHPYADQDAIGAALWLENHHSVAYRYPNDADGDLPGPRALTLEWIEQYRFEPRPCTIVEAFKACDCYEYQSCEHPTWEQSASKRFIDHLRSALIKCIPGYDDAPWRIDD